MNPSLWLETVNLSSYPSLDDNIQTEVLVIGGGLTGISCAFELLKAGKEVVLVEANRLLHGTTGYTTSKLTVQHGLIYNYLENHLGLDKAKQYYESNKMGMDHILKNIQTYGIEADIQPSAASVYTKKSRYIKKIENEFKTAETIGIPATLTTELPLPYYVKQAITFDDQYEFNVVKYLVGLLGEIKKRGGKIYEQSQVVSVKETQDEVVATLKNGRMIYADDVVIASHYPCHKSLEFYFTKLMPHFSYCIALETDEPLPDQMMINVETPVRSIRKAKYNDKDILIVAGESHDAKQTKDKASRFNHLREYADYYFHTNNELFRFSTMDYLSSDQVPLIGRINKKSPHIFLATGYGKWGMTKGAMASQIIKDLVIDGKSEYEELYAPTRFSRLLTKTFFTYNLNQPITFIKSKRIKTEPFTDIAIGEQKMVKLKGKTIGMYKDEKGKLHLCEMICPHMRCTLRFNNAEHTYDCMCHGSRFSYDGTYLDGPSKRDLTRYEISEMLDESPHEVTDIDDTSSMK